VIRTEFASLDAMLNAERSAQGVLMAAFLGLIAAITAALIARSVMISNHRQAWINGLREDLAAFFAAIDAISVRTASSRDGEASGSAELQKAHNDALLMHRRILMRLNMNEPLHQRLEKSLGALLTKHGKEVNQDEITAAVALARAILKREWEVTKYGPFTAVIIYFKSWGDQNKSQKIAATDEAKDS
jgi:hypothetical protein